MGRGKPISPDRINQVVELLKTGKNGSEVSAQTGVNRSSVYRIAERFNVAMDAHALKPDQEQRAVDMILAGEQKKTIEKLFGVSQTTVLEIARRHKIGFAGDSHLFNEQKAKANVEEANPDFEYVAGYESYESIVTVRCRACGSEKKVTYGFAARRRISCDTCEAQMAKERQQAARDRKAAQALIKKTETEVQREQREAQRAEERKHREHPCPMCGRVTINKKYCSPECARHRENNRKEQTRRAKALGVLVDTDITIEEVYQAGLGVCYLCGNPCDWSDRQERDGTIICGDRYPSIDHIVPLSRGGKHSWDNVALACRRCNYLKSDSNAPAPTSRLKSWG